VRVLVLGGEGMLGHKVFQVLRDRFDTFATFRQSDSPAVRYPVYRHVDPGYLIGGVECTRFDRVEECLSLVQPEVVVNCMGIVKQLPEAADPILCIQVNALFPHRLASLCHSTGVRMVHVSTDCVFSGLKGNYTEDDIPDPTDLYGRSKLLGEVSQKGQLTLRTSVFGRDFAKKTALLEWFLSNRGGQVDGYVNAIYSGFPTQALAGIIGDLIEDYPALSGLFHVSSYPISKYDLLCRIRDEMSLDIEVAPSESPHCDRSLDSSRFWKETGLETPDWDDLITLISGDRTPYDDWRRSSAAT
jgi:dTDP-4-dehydrorhamnose reductase